MFLSKNANVCVAETDQVVIEIFQGLPAVVVYQEARLMGEDGVERLDRDVRVLAELQQIRYQSSSAIEL
jgi:hypothetical protein